MRIPFLFFCCLVCLLFGSCTITQHIHFNKNFSGQYSMSMDMSGIMDFTEELGTTEENVEGELSDMASQVDTEAMAAEMDAVEGISNSMVTVSEKGEVVIRYDFTDVDALNAGLSALQKTMKEDLPGAEGLEMPSPEEGSSEESVPQFVLKGKTLTHRSDLSSNAVFEGMDMEDTSSMSMISAMIDVNIEISSDRKIKSYELKGLDLVQQDKNSIKARMNFEELMKAKEYLLNVRFK